MTEIHEPVNNQERYLYGINIRLDAVIAQLSSIVEYIASTQKQPIVNETVEEITLADVEKEEPVKPTPRRKKG